MEFITNYWVVLLVLFILLLLIVLSYLIDKEIRKINDSDDASGENEQSVIEDNTNNISVIEENKVEDIVSVKNENINAIIEDVGVSSENDEEKTFDNQKDDMELSYDELDVPDVDDDFNKIIHKKSIIDTSIKDIIDSLEITDVNVKEEKKEEEIVLPEIKLKKDTLDNIWE